MILILTNFNADYVLHVYNDSEKKILVETLKPYIIKKLKIDNVVTLGLSLTLSELAQHITATGE